MVLPSGVRRDREFQEAHQLDIHLKGGQLISQVLAFYHVPGGTARICLCSDGQTRIYVEESAKTEGVVFLPEPVSVPEDDE